MLILAIESSCDEFSVSVIENGTILTNKISSQIENHKLYGGVIPELAARLHFQNFSWVIESALEESSISIDKVEYIAYTEKPGLIGSLIIGKLVAETISLYYDIPLLPLHHIEGHIFGSLIDNEFKYPILALVVSGGHTQIQLVNSPFDFKIIGSTLDDAIGECYDKVARNIGFKYPGGPLLDKAAQIGDSSVYKLPTPLTDDSYNFSYSGLKTASINLIHNLEQKNEKININDFCASFQKQACSTLKKKLEKAIKEFKPKSLTVSGGVSANSSIRKMILKLGKDFNVEYTFLPKFEYCTDNGAMIAKLAYEKIMYKKNKLN